MVTKKKHKITRSRFLDWFFTDSEDVNLMGANVRAGLRSEGTYTITVQELFDTAGYIPAWITDYKGKDDDQDFQPEDCELIDD